MVISQNDLLSKSSLPRRCFRCRRSSCCFCDSSCSRSGSESSLGSCRCRCESHLGQLYDYFEICGNYSELFPHLPGDRLLLQFLLDHVCINFHLHFRLANSSPSSSPTSELSAHCWTSTWDLPSSVCTAGPQPGSCPGQCAPLDLNLGPSQLSVHRWTSTAR